MTQDQINALAREYAIWITKDYGSDNAYIPASQAQTTIFLQWLSKRYCIADKSRVQAIYAKTYPNDPDRSVTNIVVGQVLKDILPELSNTNQQ